MRINNKGFAISSMLYSILLLFLMLLLGVFAILGSRKVILDKIKSEIVTDLTQNRSYNFLFEHQNILLANTSKVSNFNFTLLDGVKIVDQNGNTVDSTVNGTYRVSYVATHQGYLIEAERIIEVVDPVTYEYAYTGREQQFIVPASGVYRAELWGAQGGSSILDAGEREMSQTWCTKGYCYGGKGAYTSGNIELLANTTFYLHVGGIGKTGVVGGMAVGGYNGGGTGDHDHNDNEADGAGGGATDIRLSSGNWDNQNGLSSRLMVAGAGGGAHDGTEAAPGGGLSSISTPTSAGATQTTGHSFGKGEDGILLRQNYPLAGAGGGYYGGYSTDGTGWEAVASGGSSYISGHIGSIAIDSETNPIPKLGCVNGTTDVACSYHYSGLIFYDTIMKAGNETMPTHDGASTMVGNSGDGYAKITVLIVDSGKVATNLIQNSSFESGTIDGWSYSSNQYDIAFDDTNAVSGKYSLKMNNKTVHTNNQQAFQTFNTVIGHVYYGTAYTNSNVNDKNNTLTRIVFSPGTAWDWLRYSPSTSIYNGVWKKHSILYANPSYDTLKFRVAIGANSSGTTIGDNYSIDNAMVLDLTEIYGAGNEPSKEWCDANIKYFDGRGIVPSY